MESRPKGNREYSLTADAIRGQAAIPFNSPCELMPYQALRSWINKKSTTEDTRWGVMIYSQKGLMISTTDDTRWGVMIYSQIRLMISTTLRAVMICQTCGLDKKSRIKMIRLFWCGRRDCDSRRELRGLVVRGSDSRLGCHSTPLLLQVPPPL